MIKAIPFNFPYDGNFVAANTALVVIDLQEDFLSTTGYFAKHGYDPTPLRAILPTVNRLIAAARAAGLKIIHTRQGYRADMADMTPYEKWRRKRAGIERHRDPAALQPWLPYRCGNRCRGRRHHRRQDLQRRLHLHRFRTCAARAGHHPSVVFGLHHRRLRPHHAARSLRPQFPVPDDF
jgi:hypothetical protein